MGTKVQRESLLLLGYHSMRDLNEDSSGCSWPFYYGDKQNGQLYNGFVSRPMADTYFGYEKDVVRRTMLEHEAVFKSQVYELHRLYRIQRDMMDEFKRKELSRNRIPVEASFSSSLYDETRKWQMPSFPLVNSVYERPSMSVVEDNGHSPISSRKGSNSHVGSVPSQNGISSKDVEPLEIRPVKVRKKMIDLHLPADEYIDTDEIDNRINGGLMKAECRTDSLNISSDFRNGNGLADLNEPINVQETNGFAFGYPHGDCEGQDLCDGRKISSISSIKEGSFNLGSAKENLSVILRSDKNGNHFGTGKMSDYSGVHKSVPPFLQPIKTMGSSQTNNSRDVVGFTQSNPRKVTSWRDRTFIDLEADTSNQEIIHQNRLESSLASNDRCLQSSGSVGQWNHLHSSRGTPRFDGFPQKAVTSVEIHPFRNVSDTMNGGNSKKQRYLMDNWSNQNGFYHGSSSASKEQQSNLSTLGYSSLNGISNLSSTIVYRDSNGSEMKPVRDVNLNVADLNEEKGTPGILPWLNSEPACKSEIADGQQRDLERPRFYEPCNGKMLDINIPSDKDLSTEDQTGFRCQIDLNMSVIEEEQCSVSLGSRLNSKVAMIDLESLPIPESDEDCVYEENSLEEHEKIAADAIVAISQAFHTENTLQWFAETIHVHGENLDQKLDTLVNNAKVDYFELMTLQLPEVNEDEYMPKPLVPEDLKFDEPSGPTLVHSQRPRRGNARRGRQRRDFQRDILPGLVSLSRHEMTEDIQTFDGLMKAMGVTWISSLTRRKTGSNQGRRRLVPPTTAANPIYCPSPSVQQNNNNNNNNDMKMGFEDKSLTGWGNMTRRPRRQRCPPAGNRSHTPYA